MTIQFRRKLLAFFVFLFAILGAGAVLYSQGYRFDFETWSPTKVGAIYIESYQGSVEIHLNNTLYKDKSGILKKGTLLSGIIPKKYQLSIRKEGFTEYQKNVEVLPSQVERFFNVLLVPQQPFYATTTVTTGTAGEITSLSAQGTIIKTTPGKTTVWRLETFPTIQSENTTNTTSTSIDITKTIASFSKQKFSSFSSYSSNQNELLAIGTAGTYKVALDKKTVTLAAPTKPVLPYGIFDNNLVSITAAPAAPTTTTTTKTTPKKQTPATTPAMIISYSIDSGASTTIPFLTPRMLTDISFVAIKNGYAAYKTTDKALWLYDTKKREEKQIAPEVTSVLFSPDAKKILHQESSGKTHVYFIEDELETANARAGDDITLALINASTIRAIYWYQDSAHVILVYPNRIMLAETTDTEPNNQFTLYEGLYVKTDYAAQTNILTVARTNTEILRLDMNTFTK